MSIIHYLIVLGCLTLAVTSASPPSDSLVADSLLPSNHVELTAANRSVSSPYPMAQEESFFVSTTARLAHQDTNCDPGEPCPLGSAIIRAQDALGEVRACYDPEEVQWGAACPEGAKPLSTSDPGYDAESGKWVFQMSTDLVSYDLVTGTVTIDFTRDITNWDSPADNRVVINSSRNQNVAITVGTDGNTLSGFELRGSYNVAAIEVRVGASNNQLGPGLILSGITKGYGIRLRDRETTGNRVVGNWCGITGDGTQVSTVAQDCIRLDKGASSNFVGGEDRRDRNVLCGSEGGAGVLINDIEGFGTGENLITGNWIGVDATGDHAVGNEYGVRITHESNGNLVIGNVISGNRTAGVSVSGLIFNTRIADNIIGSDELAQVAIPNEGWGVYVGGGAKQSEVVLNRVAHNKSGGILIAGANTRGIKVSQNSITGNRGPAVEVRDGANSRLQPPNLDVVSANEAIGRACGGCTVEIFSDAADQADTYEGTALTDVAFGTFRFTTDGQFANGGITAIALDDNENTSGISKPKYVPGYPTPGPTDGPPEGTPTPPIDGFVLHLPWLGRNAD